MSRRKRAQQTDYKESSEEESEPLRLRKKQVTASTSQQSDNADNTDSEEASSYQDEVSTDAESSVVPSEVSETSVASDNDKPSIKSHKLASNRQRPKPEVPEDNTGQIFIPKLPALPVGDVEYTESTIHPNSLAFLRDLRRNNERDWFQQRELQYLSTKQDFDSFVLSLSKRIMQYDHTIPLLPVKDLTFRIYRDIRFSNDRTPYKTFLAAYFSRTGRKGPFAGYYFSLEPGDKTLLACGLWQPPPGDLSAVRDSIDSDDVTQWYSVLEDENFIQFFGGKAGLLKTKDVLKTCPKGFPKNHKEIELLRLKSFTVSMTFKDDEVLDSNFQDYLGAVIEQMEPLVTLLNSIVRPDAADPASE